MLATREVGVYLARKQSIFRDVGLARVLVKRKNEQPRYANDDAQRGKVRWELENAGIPAERK